MTMPAGHSTSFRIAQIVGLSGAAWLSGNIASLSLITVPTLLNSQTPSGRQLSPRTLARQWRQTYEIGKSQNRPASALIGASFAFLAYRSRAGPRHVMGLYGLAALLTMGIAPFTLLAMAGTNGRLIRKSEEEGDAKESAEEGEEMKASLESWGRLNAVRSLLPLVGGAVAVIAALP
ncbi:hypothetical protein B2J93_8269 [Marssonina coronariae]|uniref:DUF1772-domain-containing protein n=1 Tax=Diplocarpon coronariae TaxID=2795749 RepID=A0A218YT19_9HELO|nr:hypothetical protein B2J93_8269 [Marssonina coronariae]